MRDECSGKGCQRKGWDAKERDGFFCEDAILAKFC